MNAKKVNIWSSQNKCIYSLRIEINYFLKFKLSTNGSTKKVLQFQLITLSSIYNIKLRCCKKSIPIEILSQNRKWGLTYAKVPLFAWIFIWFQMKKIAAVYNCNHGFLASAGPNDLPCMPPLLVIWSWRWHLSCVPQRSQILALIHRFPDLWLQSESTQYLTIAKEIEDTFTYSIWKAVVNIVDFHYESKHFSTL